MSQLEAIPRDAVDDKLSRVFAVMAVALAISLAPEGCGSRSTPIDAEPFREAIDVYLVSRNMAMAVKEIKKGPVVEGETAQLTASLSHKDLGGPSVTWTFHFEQTPDGEWAVVKYDD